MFGTIVENMQFILPIIISYFIGSFPTGYIFARLCGIIDIRNHGSGNIGATNVARILGARFFIPVFLFDACKAYANMFILLNMGYKDYSIIAAAVAHLIGNSWSVFLKGRGGKGVATTVGLVMVLQPYVMPYLFLVWVLVFLCTQTVGLASVAAIISFPIWSFICNYSTQLLFFSCFVSVWILMRHRVNIKDALARKGVN